MNLRIHKNRYSILIFISVVSTFYAVNAQDSKPIIKPNQKKQKKQNKQPIFFLNNKTNTNKKNHMA